MKVSYNWLKELVNIKVDFQTLSNDMSLHSIEIEEEYPLVKATGLVIGLVISKEPHPDSDHLSVCQVNLGKSVEQIVCGAPNVEAGQKVIVATVGAKLPELEIKKSVIRKVESNGMICSLSELGIENKYIPETYAYGIYVLDNDAPVGEDALKYLGYDDNILELGVTPNRMDLLSMLGVAYDVNAIYQLGLKPFTAPFTEANKETSSVIDVEIQTDNCYSYYARAVENVVIKESPTFIKSRLIASGIRPINNVVDITNYVLMLFGQPLHAFDKDQLGNKIIVRSAIEGEKTITLDNIERTLEPNDIVITDNKIVGGRTVCLGGVMGCSNTEVTTETKNLILESAVFKPLNIRRTSSRLGLRSESSIRFERGVDLNQSLMALNYACYLLEKYADATILKGYVHRGTKYIEDKSFTLTEKFVEDYLGVKIPLKKINEIFQGLSFTSIINKDQVEVKVPNRRLDITVEADLIEEVARIHGYYQLSETLPIMSNIGQLTIEQQKRRQIKHLLQHLGLTEVISYSLVSQKESSEFNLLVDKNSKDIVLLNPMSEEHVVLRKSLIPSLVNIVNYNNARKITNMSIYEIGKKYYLLNDNKEDKLVEELVLAGYLSGESIKTSWKGHNDKIDFYDVKGIIKEVFALLDAKVVYQSIELKDLEQTNTYLHPHRVAGIYYNDHCLGYLGELHPEYVKEHEIVDGYVFEINLDYLLSKEIPTVKYQAIPKVPAVERDLALIISKQQPLGDIIEAIQHVDKQLITSVEIFDIFEDEKIGIDKKSVAFRITLEANETLTEEIINAKIAKILKMLEYRYQIVLRG